MSRALVEQRLEDLELRMSAIETAARLALPALGSVLATARVDPLLDHGRRPRWWRDQEVKHLLTVLHRQVELQRAIEICVAAFGASRAPSLSSLHRYWMKLDCLIRRAA